MPSRPEPPFVLAIDIGSSSIRAALYDSSARPVSGMSAVQRNWQDTGADGKNEESPERIANAVEKAVDAVLATAGDMARHIVAVGLDSMASTVMGLDENGVPLTPVYTYADTRSASDVDQLKRELDVDAVHDRTGTVQHTSYVPGRIRWLRRTRPQLAAKVRGWTDVPTWLYSRWFGRTDIPASYSLASWSGMLNRRELRWDAGLLEALELDQTDLPPLAPYVDGITGLSGEYAKRWPALRDVPFFLGVGDGAAVNVGAGCVSPDRVALTIGTTGAMRVLFDDSAPALPEGLWGYRLGRERTLVGGAFSEGGNVLAWAESALDIPPLAQLGRELARLKPDGHGLTVLPFLAGERAVGWSTDATGNVLGLRVSTKPVEIVQAFMESICYRFALVADLLLPAGHETQIVASGGALLASEWWMQTMANVLQAPVSTTTDEQDTSRGTAILALHALGEWKSLDEVPTEIDRTYQPDGSVADLYRSARERQLDLYDRLFG